MGSDVYERVYELAKRRGFVYPAYELYGGSAGFYDYGPLGAQLKASLEQLFRRIYVVEEGAAEISTPAVTVEPVLKASGHVDHFSDVVITCRKCGGAYRADHFLPEELGKLRDRIQKSKAGEAFKQAVAGYIEEKIANLKEHPSVGVAEEIRRTHVREDPQRPKSLLEHRGVETPTFTAPGVEERVRCPQCQGDSFEPAAAFNLMFRTHIGPGTAKVGYLRPETAQAMFVDFPHLHRYFREKLPFAACQIGRAYRNEISPRQGLVRLREFNQMEVEAFYDPKELKHPKFRQASKTEFTLVPNTTQQAQRITIGEAVRKKIVHNAALGHHLVLVQRLLIEAGLDPKRLRFRQHLKDEMAHYAKDCWDAEYESARFGWVECVGIAYRTDYDLSQHSKHSNKPLTSTRPYETPITREVTKVVPNPSKLGPLFKKEAPRVAEVLSAMDPKKVTPGQTLTASADGQSWQVPPEAFAVTTTTETVHGEDFIPHVIEPSFGQDRILYGILEHNLFETKKEGEDYTVLRLPPAMAPVTVGIFPLMAKDGMDTLAQKIEARLKKDGIRCMYDDSGAIGRRYARADEVGTPLCITVDYDSLKDKTVTLRDRDTTQQVRVKIGALAREVRERLRATPPAVTAAIEAPK